MVKEVELKLLPKEAADEEIIHKRAIAKSRFPAHEVTEVRVKRRSIDARGSRPFVRLRAEVYHLEQHEPEPALLEQLQPVADCSPVIIVGCRAGRLLRRPGADRTGPQTHHF